MAYTETKVERESALEHAREVMNRHRGAVLYTVADHGRGAASYIRVFVAPEPDEIIATTWRASVSGG